LKRSIVLLVACLLAAYTSQAHAQFGIRGGVNLAKYVGQDAGDDGRQGRNLGASIPLFSVSALSIVPEVYYSQKGGTQRDPLGQQSFDFEVDYIEVPVLAKLRMPIPGARGPSAYVAGGPMYAWQLNCKVSASGESSIGSSECGDQFQTFQTAIKSADRGVVFGGGLDFGIGGSAG
jgi:hypothetical protein